MYLSLNWLFNPAFVAEFTISPFWADADVSGVDFVLNPLFYGLFATLIYYDIA